MMGRITDTLRRATTARGWRDSVQAVKAKYGRKASKHIAEKAGVSVRTAQKWLKGEQAPDKKVAGRVERVTSLASSDELASDALRNAQAIDAGHVDVEYDGKPQGVRNIGVVHVDAALKAALDQAANMIDAGDHSGAERVISDALIDAYTVKTGGGRGMLTGVLTISNFRTGFHIL